MSALIITSAPADVLQSGIHGMTWGDNAGSYPRLEKVREAGDVSYYVDREMVYHAVGQPVSTVIYGFFRNQLFAAYIKLNYQNQAYYLKEHFSVEYGPAKVTTADSGAETIYRWEDEKVKIKLKVNEAVEEIKLGLYYQPLSAELNQKQAEDGPSDDFAPTLPNEKTTKSAPLF
jgi:hypothetical protein